MPKYTHKYQEYVIDFLHASVDAIFSPIKVLDVKLQEVTHNVVEHKETSSLLNGSFLTVVQ